MSGSVGEALAVTLRAELDTAQASGSVADMPRPEASDHQLSEPRAPYTPLAYAPIEVVREAAREAIRQAYAEFTGQDGSSGGSPTASGSSGSSGGSGDHHRPDGEGRRGSETGSTKTSRNDGEGERHAHQGSGQTLT